MSFILSCLLVVVFLHLFGIIVEKLLPFISGSSENARYESF